MGPGPDDGANGGRGQAIARVLLAVALVLLGLFVLQNFLRALLWAVILVIATGGLYRRARAFMPRRGDGQAPGHPPGHGGHDLLLPALFTLGTTLAVLVPLVLVALQAGHEARGLATWLSQTRANGMVEPEVLRQLPLIGPGLHATLDTWWAENLADPAGARALIDRLDRDDLLSLGRTLGSHAAHKAVQFAFTLLTMFFLYRDGEAVAAQALRAADRLFGPHGERLARQVVASIHGTVDGLVLVSLGIGAVLGIAYAVVGVPHPALLGALTFVGAMVPLGATLALLLAAVLAVLAGKSVLSAGLLLAFGAAVVFVADHFIRPGLIGSATRLPFLWVLLGILGGVETLGLLGLFVGPAVMAALILLWRDWVGSGKTTAPSPEA